MQIAIDANERKELEKKMKLEQAELSYKSKSSEIMNHYFCSYYKTINKKAKDFLDKQFKEYSQDDVRSLIATIIKEQTVSQSFKKHLQEMAQEKSSELSTTISHFNIVVLGKTGIGKSTLINSFLQLDENEQAKIGIGVPVTFGKPKLYQSTRFPQLRIYDTQGIELNYYDIKMLLKDIKQLIDQKTATKDLNEMIHAMWFCVSAEGCRFEETEKQAINEIQTFFANGTLPIIIVLTKAFDQEETSAMSELIKEQMKKKIETVIPVLSKAKANIKPFGMNELLHETAIRTPEAANSSYFHCLSTQVKNHIEDLMTKLPKQAKKRSKEIIKTEITESKEMLTHENILEKAITILPSILQTMISPEKDKITVLTAEASLSLKALMGMYFQIVKNCIKLLFSNEADTIAKELGPKLFDMKDTLEKDNDLKLSNQLNIQEFQAALKPEIEKQIFDELVNSTLSIAVTNICELFIKDLQKNIQDLLSNILIDIQSELSNFTKNAMENQTKKLAFLNFEPAKTITVSNSNTKISNF